MPQLDPTSFASQIFWLALSFLILYWLMAKVALPKVASTLYSRKEKISSDLHDASRLAKEAEVIESYYTGDIQKARSEASALLAESSRQAETEAQQRHREFDEMLEKKLAESEKQLAKSREAALQEIVAISSGLSRAIVKRLTELDVTDKDSAEKVKDILKQKAA